MRRVPAESPIAEGECGSGNEMDEDETSAHKSKDKMAKMKVISWESSKIPAIKDTVGKTDLKKWTIKNRRIYGPIKWLCNCVHCNLKPR